MKTNMMMEVNIGEYGTLNIGHKDQFGKVQDVINACNYSDSLKGGKGNYAIHSALKSIDFWKYVMEVDLLEKLENKEGIFNSSDSDELDSVISTEFKKVRVIANYDIIYKNLNKEGEVNYSKLIKIFPNLIKSKRGKYGGTWATLPILLKIASNADKAIEAVIYKTFIDSEVLVKRDIGGEEFKRLNKLLDTLPDRINKDNKGVYIQVAKKVNEKIKGEFKQTWNKEGDDSMVQDRRGKLLDKLSFTIEYNFITSYPQVKEMIETYKF